MVIIPPSEPPDKAEIRALSLVSLAALLALGLTWLSSACGPVPKPRPPAPSSAISAQRAALECTDLYLQELRRDPDVGGLQSCVDALVAGRTGEQQREILKASAEWAEAHKPPPPTPVLHTDGKIFRTADGQAWRYKGVSAFKLLHLHSVGQTITPFLDAYQGFNVLRVWAYVEGPAWQGRDWPTPPTVEQTKAFLAFVGAKGWTVELTLLTDDHPDRLAWARMYLRNLGAAPKPTNLLIELGNEPRTHKAIDTAALKADAEAAGFLFASGDYEQSARIFGSYGVAHTGRTSDWPRRAHDLLEYFVGGGPHAASDPPHKIPWVADEPGKPADVGTSEADWRAYFGAVSLMGAGGTFHAETNKYGDLPTDTERRLAAITLSALNAFPADAPNGGYRRIVESGQPRDARTYVIGERYMVRSQQKGTMAPEAGWTSLDALGVLWKR